MAEEEGHENMAIVGVLIGLITFLSFVLVWIMFPPLMDLIRRKMPVSQKRIDRRYATIDGWLISKRVQPHDACCELLIRQLAENPEKYVKPPCTSCSSDTSSATQSSCSGSSCSGCSNSSSNKKDAPPPQKRYIFNPGAMLTKLSSIHWETEDADKQKGDDMIEEDPELQLEEPQDDQSVSTDGDDLMDDNGDIMNKKCAICLEKFRIGEAVSWSCDISCQHVFHHECLRNWLLRRVQCPCCRTIVLPVDKPKLKLQSSKRPRRLFGGEKFTSEELKEMASVRSKYLTRTYFCVEEGLIILRSIEDDRKKREAAAAAASKAAPTTNDTERTVKDDEDTNSSCSSTPSETKRNFLFWKCKRQDDTADGNGSDLLNTTRSMCSGDSFGDVDDEEGATPYQLRRCSTGPTISMGSGPSEAFDSSAFDDSDLEAADSTDASETDQGLGNSCRTSDDEYGRSYRSDHDLGSSYQTNEDEDGRDIIKSCRASEDGIDDVSSSSSSAEKKDNEEEPIDQSERTHNGMEIVHLDVIA
ncbi:unnamed protein product [Cylindrotheca closterium]|uniref:RING-type domain-containing protein n=1 Tax=Cylindrotheca closterium TaxID=2856 RepID=A0AAD2GBB7_9STRA|nr:unnamed protein product [Cylindrotheca closterium]